MHNGRLSLLIYPRTSHGLSDLVAYSGISTFETLRIMVISQ